MTFFKYTKSIQVLKTIACVEFTTRQNQTIEAYIKGKQFQSE